MALVFVHGCKERWVAKRGERAAEAGACRRLLTLARAQNWPKTVVRGPDGWHFVEPNSKSWKRSAKEWNPAVVVIALHQLYLRRAASASPVMPAEGMDVLDVNGEKTGTIVRVRDGTDSAGRFTVKRRGLFKRAEMELPAELIQDIGEDGVVLKLSKQALKLQQHGEVTREHSQAPNLRK